MKSNEREKILTLKGMDCADCASRIEQVVSKIPGVKRAKVSFEASRLSVTPESSTFDERILIAAVKGLGYSVETEEFFKTVTLYIEEMDCADESEIIEKKMRSQMGVRDFEIYLMSRQLKVSYDPSLISAQDMIKAVAETGMKASMVREKRARVTAWWKEKRMVFLFICGVLTVTAYILDRSGTAGLIVRILYTGAIIIGGYYPAKTGLSALRMLTMNINTLLVIATIGAMGLDLWEEAAVLVFVYSLGSILETYAVDKARGALRALMDIVPHEALVRRNGSETVLPVEEIALGDAVIVRPGEKIPLDGKVVSGSSFVDQASITGESLPAEKKTGDEVFAGSINQRGSLEIEVTKKSVDTTLARIIHSVEESQAKKSTYQRFGERFGRYYTPAMFVLGIGVALIPPLLFGRAWSPWFYRALVVFVVSCSCGLALSVPVSVVAAISNAARKGVIFKGGVYLELAERLRAVAFDKTGTLTIGRPVVTDIIAYHSLSQKDVLSFAASVESRSEHPLAEAIVRKAKEEGISLRRPEDFEALAGLGVKAKIDGDLYVVGSRHFILDRGISDGQIQDDISRLEKEGKTAVFLGNEQDLLGVLAIADTLRAEAKEAIGSLRVQGIKIIMLTGDNEGTARAIAEAVGVDEYLAQLLPEDKVEAVKKLKEKFGVVAMVGDGINDAPAMAVSDVGIAMGAAGTDVAMETGDIALMSDNLSMIPAVLRLSRRSIANIRQNIVVSLALVAFLIPAALTGWLDLVPGLLINEVSALIVIANGLRLLRIDNRGLYGKNKRHLSHSVL